MNLNYLFEIGDGSGEFGELEKILPKKNAPTYQWQVRDE
jgi:hypothetical protein